MTASPDQFAQAVQQKLQPADKFRGSARVAYRIATDGTLTFADAHTDRTLVVLDNGANPKPPLIAVTPQYFNGPDLIFKGLDKCTAYVKVTASQHRAQSPLTSQLSWTVLFPLLAADHENIKSTPIPLSSDSIQNLSAIPIPGNTADLVVALMALVGPPAKTAFTIVNATYQRLASIANSPAANTPLFVIPAADLIVAKQVEGLIQSVVNAFQSDSQLQYWTRDDRPLTLTLKDPGADATGNGSGIVLADGDTTVVVTPDSTNEGDPLFKDLPIITTTADTKIGSYTEYLQPCLNKKFQVTRSGIVLPAKDGDPNPFSNVPYITLTLSASAS